MLKSLASTLTAACLALTAGNIFGQDVYDMNSAFNSRMNSQLQPITKSIVESNMSSPHVRQLYQQYLQLGGLLNFSSYCFRCAEVGGFTPEGNALAIQAKQPVHLQDQAYINAYLRHLERNHQDAYNNRQANVDKCAHQRGENSSGHATYVNNSDGSSWQLPTNMTASQIFYDNSSGNYFGMDIHGQCWMRNGQDGWQ